MTPKAVPVSLRREKNFGNAVAAKTVKVDMRGRDEVPTGRIVLVKKDPAVTKVDATEMAIASEGRVMEEVSLFSSTAISAIVVCSCC
mmetsp:Transcript_29132/g.54744  ORF Transcript_29132/g.54744 Transcript_29132/m.54744 type:complete len:87 (-) Transcript_29132:37-297(-)